MESKYRGSVVGMADVDRSRQGETTEECMLQCGYPADKLVKIRLRCWGGCPGTIKDVTVSEPYVIEEAYEVVEATAVTFPVLRGA